MLAYEIDEDEILEKVSNKKLLSTLLSNLGSKEKTQDFLEDFALEFEGFGQSDVDYLVEEQSEDEFLNFANELAWKSNQEQRKILIAELNKYMGNK